MILAVIPARGGSKRLPGKNIAAFGGRPLIAWSVALAKRLDRVAACVVSTESPEIAAVARQAGAEVIDRPAELAGDDSSMTQVLIHAARAMLERGLAFDAVMLLQPTNPLRPLAMVEQAISRFYAEPCDSLIAVSSRRLKFGKVSDGIFLPSYQGETPSRTTAPVFYENGLLYLTKLNILLGEESVYGSRILACEAERPFDEVDIDEPVDLVVGEAILHAVSGQLGY